jgi:hypothetical protein
MIARSKNSSGCGSEGVSSFSNTWSGGEKWLPNQAMLGLSMSQP